MKAVITEGNWTFSPLHVKRISCIIGGRHAITWDGDKIWHPMIKKMIAKLPWYKRLFVKRSISYRYNKHEVVIELLDRGRYDSPRYTFDKLDDARDFRKKMLKIWDDELAKFHSSVKL